MIGLIPETGAIAGLVLAGGRSRRMGQDKAGLRIGGETLLARQVRLMQEAGVGECWVSMGFGGREEWEGVDERVSRVRDEVEDGGPMEGIRQVLERSHAGHLLVLAVDLPGLSTGFLGRLMAKRRAGGGAVPMGVRGLEPLCAVYPVGQALAAVRAWGGNGECSPRRLVSDGLEEGWMESWRVEEPDQACLVNWNQPGDWAGGSAGFGFRRMKGPVRISGAA